MNRKHLITLAVLATLGAAVGSAQAAGNDDPAFGAMAPVSSSLTREEVRSELLAARAEGRMELAGEITTPDSVLIAQENHTQILALVASQKAELLAMIEASQVAANADAVEVSEASGSSGTSGLNSMGGSAEVPSPSQVMDESSLMPLTSVMPADPLPAEPVPANPDMAPAPANDRSSGVAADGLGLQPVVMLVDLDEDGEPMLVESMDLD